MQKSRRHDRSFQLLGNQQGVALIGVLVAVVILGLMSSIAGSSWTSIVQRAKEEELLWRGDQYRRAIESYYKSAQAGAVSQLPPTLESLLKDPRSLATQRHIRKLYPDPLTGGDWLLVKDPSGGISGVRSSSTLEPFKKDGFNDANKDFASKTSYNEWQFVFNAQAAKNKATTQPTTKSQ
jgi:type II secretory pathway pseudopilin PulG